MECIVHLEEAQNSCSRCITRIKLEAAHGTALTLALQSSLSKTRLVPSTEDVSVLVVVGVEDFPSILPQLLSVTIVSPTHSIAFLRLSSIVMVYAT
jgi:hypothetical protein